MPKRYPPEVRGKARRLYESGLNEAAVADLVGAHEDTVKGWRKREEWSRTEAPTIGAGAEASPLQVQEHMEQLVCLELYRLSQSPDPDPTVLARWQDIHAKTRSIIRSIYEQAADPEVFCRVVELMAQHLGSLPKRQQAAIASILEPFLTSFEAAIRSGAVAP